MIIGDVHFFYFKRNGEAFCLKSPMFLIANLYNLSSPIEVSQIIIPSLLSKLQVGGE